MITNSLIVPFYNEESKVVLSLNKLLEFIKQQQRGWEILIVNDGSNDRTLDLLKNFSSNFFEIISYPTNKGKGYAIKTAISSASGKYTGFTDGDIPYSFEDVKNAFDVIKGCDIVIGSRKLAQKGHVKTTP
ncbi:MAG: glycosyltransferase, partial [Candidatus Thorarchaeota archaeon]